MINFSILFIKFVMLFIYCIFQILLLDAIAPFLEVSFFLLSDYIILQSYFAMFSHGLKHLILST
jgi:hypothetical protein